MCDYIVNPFYNGSLEGTGKFVELLKSDEIGAFHRIIKGYKPTPLVSIQKTAEKLGVNEILVKDESKRFGVNAFKPLGASYAIYKIIEREWKRKFRKTFKKEFLFDKELMNKLGKFVFSAASDGNHGKAVAWTAKLTGNIAKIFMPADTKIARIKNIEVEGSEVILIDGTYDDCVREVAVKSKENGWYEVADTAYDNYTEIPTWVAAGYSTIFNEIKEELNSGKYNYPDIVILQAGVGAFAASGTAFFKIFFPNKDIKTICVEPIESAGFFDSIKYGNGNIIPARGKMKTIMAGLNCGIPSSIAWPVLKNNTDVFITVSDKYAKDAMRAYYLEDIISGESGASGLAGLLAIIKNKELVNVKMKLNISNTTNILLISTEGNTDPDNFNKIVINN